MIRFIRPIPLLLAGMLVLPLVQAYTLEQFSFKDPEKTEEFRKLTEELRCLVCQNESLAASQADLAQDLRKEVYQMMRAGKSRDEIIRFLVARYGDFVLYDPPVKLSTYPLWFGPLILAGAGGFFLLRAIKKKKQAEEQELSPEERDRLAQLLATTGKQQDTAK